ncbi:unnamed protein product [Chondrus crispus]|uniref:Uncharacterized protein n=1 Tax=Chondrus crispus TaxID=2769 RepID=R7QSN0_CHOCR|nr:unnamed protein product [Chondrus crispus]CDF41144.1 unnamed protein product [Chondrus crispus]|eukprot:XP_005711438.1 unnamed protein product [Chondrus crispus]
MPIRSPTAAVGPWPCLTTVYWRVEAAAVEISAATSEPAAEATAARTTRREKRFAGDAGAAAGVVMETAGRERDREAWRAAAGKGVGTKAIAGGTVAGWWRDGDGTVAGRWVRSSWCGGGERGKRKEIVGRCPFA